MNKAYLVIENTNNGKKSMKVPKMQVGEFLDTGLYIIGIHNDFDSALKEKKKLERKKENLEENYGSTEIREMIIAEEGVL